MRSEEGMRYAGMNWTVESDGLYGVYVRADRMDLVLAEAIERWLDAPVFIPEMPLWLTGK